MPGLFAVLRTHGGAWDETRRLEDQPEWPAHAAFMDALHKDGFTVLVGPLEGAPHALLILRADSAEEIEARLAPDPWTLNGLLRTTLVAPWTLRLGSLDGNQRR
jgi:uncharacterized protein YciI